MVSLSAVCCI